MINYSAWKYYIGLYRESHKKLLFSILVLIFQVALLLPVPLLIQRAFDDIIPSNDFSGLALIGGILLSIYQIFYPPTKVALLPLSDMRI